MKNNKYCKVCKGTGFDFDGAICYHCGGTGYCETCTRMANINYLDKMQKEFETKFCETLGIRGPWKEDNGNVYKWSHPMMVWKWIVSNFLPKQDVTKLNTNLTTIKKPSDWDERVSLARARCSEIVDLDVKPPVKYTAVKCKTALAEIDDLDKLHKILIGDKK